MLKNKEKIKQAAKKRRQIRTRAKIFGTAKRPRLSVSRSLHHLYLQMIDDEAGKTLVSLHTRNLKDKGTKTAIAEAAGLAFAKAALDKKINTCIFDRAGYKYHGRVKALAEGLRKGGLKF